MNILAIEPYYGGSHREFLDRAKSLSVHHWSLVTQPPRHWKWRMRSSPLTLSAVCLDLLRQRVSESAQPFDAIICSDMLDLPTWLGFVARDRSQIARDLLEIPITTYFHESQWDYPVAPGARVDHHFGYTNLLTAAASDACWFNSQFHLDAFFDSCKGFVARMPDGRELHDLSRIESHAAVLPPGFQSNPVRRAKNQSDSIRIGWVARWEHDKRPDVFLQLLGGLAEKGFDFQLVLLGSRRGNEPDLLQIEKRFDQQIIVNEYADSRQRYLDALSMIDIVVSTADHEFFGMGVCEAIDAGAAPVLPDRLSYRELTPDNQRYRSVNEAVDMIVTLNDSSLRDAAARTARQSIENYAAEFCIAKIDEAIDHLVRGG